MGLSNCKYCNNLFSPRRKWQAFCGERCRNAWHNTSGKEETALRIKLLEEELVAVKAESANWEAKYYSSQREKNGWQHELAGTSHKPEAPSAYSKEFIREIVDGDG